MAITYVGNGGMASGTGDVTPSLPSYTDNDILILTTETDRSNTVSTPSGWTLLLSKQSSSCTDTNLDSYLYVFWLRASGTVTAPTITDPGNHCNAVIHCFRGCYGTGTDSPFGANTTNAGSDATNTVNFATITTTVNNACILLIHAIGAYVSTSTLTFGANISSGTADLHDTDSSGNGGGLALAHGWVTSSGTSTGASTWLLTQYIGWASATIELKPSTGLSISGPYESVTTNSINTSLLVKQWKVNVFDAVTANSAIGYASLAKNLNRSDSVTVTEYTRFTGILRINTFQAVSVNSSNSTVSKKAYTINVFDAKTVSEYVRFLGTVRINLWDQITTNSINTTVYRATWSAILYINVNQVVTVGDYWYRPPSPSWTNITEIEVGKTERLMGYTTVHNKALVVTCGYTTSPDTDYWNISFVNLLVRDVDGNEKILSRKTTDSAISGQLQVGGANGLDTGSPRTAGDATYTIVWYYLYVIYNPDTKTIATLASLVNGLPELPTGYTFYRRVGVMAYYNPNSSTHRAYPSEQYDDYFFYIETGSVLILAGTSSANWNKIDSNKVPSCVRKAIISYGATTTNRSIGLAVADGGIGGEIFRSKSTTGTTGYFGGNFAYNFNMLGTFEIPIRLSTTYDDYVEFYYYTEGAETMAMYCIGWYDDLALYY